MARQVTIVTPENVHIEYELAGMASRAGAAIVDLVLQGLLILALIGIRFLLAHFNKWPGTSWATAALGILGFVLWYGYYVYFETVWNGQSPGKRYSRLRTIREGGMPIDFVSAATRNLVRIIDFLPLLYLLGLIVILFSSRNKRLGDHAAGTIVVKERSEWINSIAQVQKPSVETLPQYPEAEYVRNIELVSSDEFEALRRFVERKAELSAEIREQLARKIAAPLIERLGIQVDGFISYSNLLTEIHNRCISERGMR